MVIASAAVLHKFNTSKTSARHPVPPTPSAGDHPQPSMRLQCCLPHLQKRQQIWHRSSPLLHHQRHHQSGSDYSGFNRIYSFRSGQSYLDVTVKTNKDTTKENTEYFYGRISAYRSGDRISGSSAQIQYLKDVSTSSSSTYTISRRSSSTINEGSNAVFRIYRNGNRSGTGQVRFYTTNGTARSGSDYSGFNRIYSFRSGQSYLDVTVKTNKDTTKENTEYFYGRISAYRSVDRISGSSAQIQYLKDVSTSSSSTYTISRRSSSTINEGSNAVFRIYRNGNRSGPVKSATTTNGTAKAAVITQVLTASTPSVVDSPTSM